MVLKIKSKKTLLLVYKYKKRGPIGVLKIKSKLPNLTSSFQTHKKVGDKLFTYI